MPKLLCLLQGRYGQSARGVRVQGRQRLRSGVLPMKRDGVQALPTDKSHHQRVVGRMRFFKSITIVSLRLLLTQCVDVEGLI
jgi:hypothetical protein